MAIAERGDNISTILRMDTKKHVFTVYRRETKETEMDSGIVIWDAQSTPHH